MSGSTSSQLAHFIHYLVSSSREDSVSEQQSTVWCRFVGRQDLYLRDGLHLRNYGAAVIGDEFLKVMSDITPFLG